MATGLGEDVDGWLRLISDAGRVAHAADWSVERHCKTRSDRENWAGRASYRFFNEERFPRMGETATMIWSFQVTDLIR